MPLDKTQPYREVRNAMGNVYFEQAGTYYDIFGNVASVPPFGSYSSPNPSWLRDPSGRIVGLAGDAGANILKFGSGPVTVGIIGDSIVQDVNGNDSSNTASAAGNSANFVNWAACYSFGRMWYTKAMALGGWTIDDVNANIDANYIPQLPDVTVLQIGFNNLSGINTTTDTGNVGATFRTKLITLINKLRSLGTVVILCTISPKNTGMAGFTNTQQKHIYSHNAWVRRYCNDNRLPLFDYANYVADPADTTNGGLMNALFQSSPAHVHGGAEINRALGREFWTNCISKLFPGSQALNYGGLNYNSNGNSDLTYLGVNLIPNPMLAGSGGTVTAPSTGTLPTSWSSFGNAGNAATYSVSAVTGAKALSDLDVTGVSGGGQPGNYIQCSIDTSIAANLYTLNTGPGVSVGINFSYGGLITLPQRCVLRVRIKATALANCAGIIARVITGLGGFIYMNANSQGITPTTDPNAVVRTPFDVLYQSPPFTIAAGSGASVTLQIFAMIIATAAGTTTFQISQPELLLLPSQTA